MRYGEAVATGTGGPTAVVSAIRDYLLELADPRYSPSELVMLSEAVTALAQTFSPAAELRWALGSAADGDDDEDGPG